MAQLAIRGHATRGREVIELLEMLGGKQFDSYNGNDINWCYTIINGSIEWDYPSNKYVIYTLEEFLEKFPYKVGDKVTLDKFPCEIKGMSWEYDDIIYYVKGVDFSKGVYATDLQPYKEETMGDKNNLLQQLKEYFENTPREVIEKEWHEYDKYNEIGPDVIEYLEYVNNIRQPQYPKTFIECAKIIDCFCAAHIDGYKNELLEKLQELLVCRDAYWKIAGDWKPKRMVTGSGILVFPTEEMRNAFYENFMGLIEQCRELL